MPISSTTRQYAIPLLLVIATLAIYAVTGSFDLLYTWDDRLYILTNSTVHAFTLTHLQEAFSDYYVGNYAPLTILSYMIDHALWGLRPTGYHLENILLHAANGLLFYTLLRRLSFSDWQAGAAAWIFLLHPVQVETVAWVSQRKSLLAMCFFLAALLCYQSYAALQANHRRSYLLSLASIAAALFSKSVAVIFPAVIVLYDLTYDRGGARPTRQRLLDKVPFLVIAAVVAALAVISQAHDEGGGRGDYPGGSPLATFYTMVPVLAGYLRDGILPFDLSPYYLVTIRQQPDAVFIGSLAVLLALALVGTFLYRAARPLFFWYGLFLIALVPVMQIVPLITLKNDRYLYTPLLGFAVLVVLGGQRIFETIHGRWRYLASCCVAFVMLALPLLAFKQSLYWRNDLTLWNRAATVDPRNSLAWLQLTKCYTALHDTDNAVRAFNRYTELRRRYGPVRGFERY